MKYKRCANYFPYDFIVTYVIVCIALVSASVVLIYRCGVNSKFWFVYLSFRRTRHK